MKNDTLKSCVLKNIRYESSGGSMNYHSEFEIESALLIGTDIISAQRKAPNVKSSLT